MAPERTLGRLAERSWAGFGDFDALYHEGVWHRAHALAERVRGATAGLRRLGVGPGDRVLVMAANRPEVLIAYRAAWAAGAVVTPVVPLVSADELAHIVADGEPRALVVSAELLPLVLAATRDLPVVVTGEAPEGEGRVVGFAELEDTPGEGHVDRDEGDLAALLYTGGTTGRAKGVMLTHAGLWQVSRAAHEVTYRPGVTRGIIPVPLSHSYGLIVALTAMHSPEPQHTVVMRAFTAKAFLQIATEHRVQYGAVVPAMVRDLLDEPLETTPLPDLLYLTCGAAPLGREAIEEFERRMAGVRLLEGYGLTETSAVATVNPPDRRKVGSAGPPLPGYTITIRDDDGEPVEPGDLGEICVHGEPVMRGYWRSPETTARALVDGELRTGDIGCVDDDGYLYVVDRRKDLIIRGGFTIFPRDVEDALNRHPDVAMSGVVGRPDPRLGEEVVAFVRLRPGATVTAEALTEWARDRVGRLRHPREIRFVDAIPMTSVLKVDRRELRSRLARESPTS
ncbi:long-chain-fatty-acid--CoA ligase [Sphaerisporangium siamense]|uniref:Long-chain acyl-CoA synthetase n=1 Tax=Sphaerisporangium siamense TaxID=795645 RepID=A0A7W7G7B5_9ACTN|nr:AMP-binding protein [Sphaerisporangium siamense]MBB4700448.1 long-chain acyl-CoA synthetase [Sphaerisporangium siamense]GII88389.1 long-chain-fatty-acid--CoA ligase [Sphaerisporangium siamense]